MYQIYPRSFKDSDNNGIGDLAGIESKLDYLTDLGVTAIWLSPIYPSPMVDFGYDISDYRSVDPIFGSAADLDRLIDRAHQKGIKLIMDLTPNHTSDQHPWFLESRQSRHNPKRDWYIWKDPDSNGGPPNNWLSSFHGSAWEFDKTTKQYYLHSFAKEQPDLNWENPEVRTAIKEVMRFWFNKGVDGFRVDAVYWLGKDPLFRDDPPNPHFDPKKQPGYEAVLHSHSKRGAQLYTYLKELSDVAKQYDNRILITEAYPHRRFSYQAYLTFYKHTNPSVLAPFNFEAIFLPWQASAFQNYIDGFQHRLKRRYVPVYAMGNHDKPRLATRFGRQAARATAMILLTLPGVPVIYYGEEIGMENVLISPKHLKDIGQKHWPAGPRDAERTPMQWSADKHAGFSKVKPWLPVAGDYKERNVERELQDPTSLLRLYQQLLAVRKNSAVLTKGKYRPLNLNQKDVFGFVRSYHGKRMAVVVNFSKNLSFPIDLEGKTILSTHPRPIEHHLQPLEGKIIDLSA